MRRRADTHSKTVVALLSFIVGARGIILGVEDCQGQEGWRAVGVRKRGQAVVIRGVDGLCLLSNRGLSCRASFSEAAGPSASQDDELRVGSVQPTVTSVLLLGC